MKISGTRTLLLTVFMALVLTILVVTWDARADVPQVDESPPTGQAAEAMDIERVPAAPARDLAAEYVDAYVYSDTTGLANLNDYDCASPEILTIDVGDTFTVGDVDVGINLNHAHRGDVFISLESPDGTVVDLIEDADVADPSYNYDVRVDDISPNPRDDGDEDRTAAPYYDRTIAPVTSYLNAGGLNAFEGEEANGAWHLRICDQDTTTYDGDLNHWSLFFREPAPEFDRLAIKGLPYKVEPGDVVTYALYLRNTGSLTASQLLISDSLPSGVAQRAPATFDLVDGATTILSGTTDPITWSGSIPPNGTLVAYVPVTITASAATTITNTAVLTDPALAEQVTISATARVYEAGAIHYYEGINLWTGTANDRRSAGSWAVGGDWFYFPLPLPIIGPPHAHSGLLALGTNLGGAYHDDATSVMTSVLELTGIPSDREITLQWGEWLDMAADDEAYIEIASTGYPTPTLFYGQHVGGFTAEQAAHEGRWFEVQRDITRYRGQTITLTFTIDPNGDGSASAGWYVDDISVLLAPGRPSFEHARKVAHPYVTRAGQDINYTIHIHNSGAGAATDGQMVDQIPAELSIQNVTLAGAGTVSHEGQRVTWESTPSDPLLAGHTAVITVEASVPWETACGVALTNTAIITDGQALEDQMIETPLFVYPGIDEDWDLEADDGGFVHEGSGEWEWGAPDPAYPLGPRSAHSGERVWGTDLDADAYDGWTITHVLTRTLTLPDDPRGLYLRWWDWFDEDGGDTRRVKINSTVVWRDTTAQRHWAAHGVDLSAWAGETVVLSFDLVTSGGDPGAAGWYLDDISLHRRCSRLELGPPQRLPICPGSTLTYPLTLKNATRDWNAVELTTESAWPAEVVPLEMPLEAGASAPVTATVAVPWMAEAGAIEDIVVGAHAQDGGYTETLTLQAIAGLGSGWDGLAPTLQGTRFHGLAHHNGYLYQIGGETDLWTPTDAVQRYDIAGDNWGSVAALPVVLSGADAVVLGDRIYVPGGSDDTDTPFDGGTFLDTLHIYDPAANAWGTGAALPTPLAFASAVALEGKLYVIGGQVDDGSYVDTLTIYDPATDSWSQGAAMSEARAYAGAGVIGGEIYVVGGYAGDNINRDSLEIYDPVTDAWRQGPDLPDEVSSHAVGVVDGRYLVVAGGGEMTEGFYRCSEDAWAFDAVAEHWFPLPDLNRCLYGAAMTGVGADLYLISGRTNEGVWHMATEAEQFARCATPPDAGWRKKVADMSWVSGMSRTVATGDVVMVTDVITAGEALTLSERWDPDRLSLVDYTLNPPGTGHIVPEGTWQTAPSSPFAYSRADAEYAESTGLVYVLGGRQSDGNDYPDVWAFNPQTGVYTDTGTDMPAAVTNYVIARLTDGDGRKVLVIFGGYRESTGGFTDVVQGYYPDDDTATLFVDDPLPVKGIPGGVVVVDNQAYVFGGIDDTNTMLDATYIFDITAPAGSRWSNGPAMNRARRYIPSAAVDGVIYALGGDVIGGLGLVAVTTTEKLDTSAGVPAWDEAGVPPMPIACDEVPAFGFDSTASHALAGSVVIAGCGQWSDESGLSLRYDAVRDQWDLGFPSLNQARRNHAGALVPSHGDGGVPEMWVWGGRYDNDSNVLHEPEHYVLSELNWVVPAGTTGPLTFTKYLAVDACTWTETELQETLWMRGGAFAHRPVTFIKPEPQLEVGSTYSAAVQSGELTTFTLHYTNTGGYENDVRLYAAFPAEARFERATPAPQAWDETDYTWAEWELGDLAANARGHITVTVAITEGLPPGTSVPLIVVRIYDHADIARDAASIGFNIWCQCIEDMTLSKTNPGTIYTDTLVTFRADIAPDDADKPYTYTIDYDDGTAPITATSSDDPLSFQHNFDTVGSYEVQVATWNCTMTQAITDVLALSVYAPGDCVEIDSVTIEGATSGEPGVYTFTAATAPSNASLPIDYLWQGGGDTATITRTLGLGDHTLVVTASNGCSTVTDTHTITIDEGLNHIYLPLVVRSDGV